MGLAAIDVTADGVEVVELNGGSGTYSFDYVVHAVRKGFEDYQVYLSQEEAQQLTGSLSVTSIMVGDTFSQVLFTVGFANFVRGNPHIQKSLLILGHTSISWDVWGNTVEKPRIHP